MRAADIVLAVAQSCEGVEASSAESLQRDLAQLTRCVLLPVTFNAFANRNRPFSTMVDILQFTQKQAELKGIRKMISRSNISASVAILERRLEHSFDIFHVCISCQCQSLLNSMNVAQIYVDGTGWK